MFDSDLFRFAVLMDNEFIERLSSIDSCTPEDIEKANSLEQHASTLLEFKIESLQSLARNMADSTQADEPTSSATDHMNVWTMVADDLKAIRELQDLIRRINHYISKDTAGGRA